MKLKETQLPQLYSNALYNEKCLDLAPEHMDKMFDILFTSVANLLNNTKSLTTPAAFVFKELNGTFIAGAVCQYFDNEDKANPGNWSLVWTFNENDIPASALKMTLSDAQTHSYFIAVAGEKYGIQYKNSSALVDCLTYALVQLNKWLDENAKDGTEVSIELDGIFQARVGIENGEKVFAIEPDGEIKNLIKSDASIEK